MTLLEIMLEIEEGCGLFDKELDGICYWACQRDYVYRLINEKKNQVEVYSDKNARGLLGKVRVAGSILGCMLKSCRVRQAPLLFIVHPRRQKKGDSYECIYTSALAEGFEDSLSMEFYSFHGHKLPAAEKDTLYMDSHQLLPEFRGLLESRLNTGKYKGYLERLLKDCREPVAAMLRAYGVSEAETVSIIKAVAKRQTIYYYKRPVYRKLLKKINPRAVVEVISISPNVAVMNDVAHELGIPVIELQHGPVDESFFHYNYGKTQAKPQFPDHICVFSKYWKDYSHMPIPKENIRVTGFPFFERSLRQYEGRKKKSGILTVCFLSQPTIGKWLADMAADFIELGGDYRVIYKLHPSEYSSWRRDYPRLEALEKEGRAEVVDNAERKLYEVLSESDIQVGVHSTSVFEGLGFGLRTYIYRIQNSETMKNLCSSGFGVYVDSAARLRECIESSKEINAAAGEFWERDALKKLDAVVREIMAEGGKGEGKCAEV